VSNFFQKIGKNWKNNLPAELDRILYDLGFYALKAHDHDTFLYFRDIEVGVSADIRYK